MTSLAEAIKELRIRVGGHEKLAELLGTTRNTVMNWQKPDPTFPTKFTKELQREGIPAELLQRPAKPRRGGRLQALEEQVSALTEGLDTTTKSLKRLRARVANQAKDIGRLTEQVQGLLARFPPEEQHTNPGQTAL